MKEEGIDFVAGNESAEGLQPTDGAFDDPPLAITPEWSTILRGRTHAALSMRADDLDVASRQALPQGITICGPVIDQPAGNVRRDGLGQQRLDESHFGRARAVDIDRDRHSRAIDQEHQLGSLAPFRRTDQIAPFLPSAVGEALLPIDIGASTNLFH